MAVRNDHPSRQMAISNVPMAHAGDSISCGERIFSTPS